MNTIKQIVDTIIASSEAYKYITNTGFYCLSSEEYITYSFNEYSVTINMIFSNNDPKKCNINDLEDLTIYIPDYKKNTLSEIYSKQQLRNMATILLGHITQWHILKGEQTLAEVQTLLNSDKVDGI